MGQVNNCQYERHSGSQPPSQASKQQAVSYPTGRFILWRNWTKENPNLWHNGKTRASTVVKTENKKKKKKALILKGKLPASFCHSTEILWAARCRPPCHRSGFLGNKCWREDLYAESVLEALSKSTPVEEGRKHDRTEEGVKEWSSDNKGLCQAHGEHRSWNDPSELSHTEARSQTSEFHVNQSLDVGCSLQLETNQEARLS